MRRLTGSCPPPWRGSWGRPGLGSDASRRPPGRVTRGVYAPPPHSLLDPRKPNLFVLVQDDEERVADRLDRLRLRFLLAPLFHGHRELVPFDLVGPVLRLRGVLAFAEDG